MLLDLAASKDKATPISKSHTLDEMVEFWDSHSTADFDEQTHEVEIEFDASVRLNREAILDELLAPPKPDKVTG